MNELQSAQTHEGGARSYFRFEEEQRDLREKVQSDRILELEVGSGKGLFLISAASRQADRYFIGLELAAKFAAMAQARIERSKVENAHCYSCDAIQVMVNEIPDNRLHAVHVYFPDPWWKARHKKRRVLNETMVQAIERTLIPGGELHFWTDVLDYYESTLELIAEKTKLMGPTFVEEPTSEHDMDYRTHFERRTRLNGLPVYRSRYQKA
jgi:tRNA (guanine-N7-)-methyltransferase